MARSLSSNSDFTDHPGLQSSQRGVVVGGTDFGLRQACVRIVFCQLQARRFEASHLISLGPHFFSLNRTPPKVSLSAVLLALASVE